MNLSRVFIFIYFVGLGCICSNNTKHPRYILYLQRHWCPLVHARSYVHAYTWPAADTGSTKGPCLFLHLPQHVWQQIRVSALLSCSMVHAHVHSFAPQGFSRVVRTDVRSVSAYFTLAVPAGGHSLNRDS